MQIAVAITHQACSLARIQQRAELLELRPYTVRLTSWPFSNRSNALEICMAASVGNC